MDAYTKNIVTLKNPSSKMAFGDWSLGRPDGEDLVPSNTFFNRPSLSKHQLNLGFEALDRLLPKDVRNLLYLTAVNSDESLFHQIDAKRKEIKIQSYAFEDLKPDSTLPYEDGCFDAVVFDHQLGVMEKPIEVFREAGRVLIDGGICIADFIQPFFTKDLTRMWALGDDRDHIVLVDSFFEYSNAFTKADIIILYQNDDGLAWNRLGAVPDPSIRDYVHFAWAYKGENKTDRKVFPEQRTARPVERKDIHYDKQNRPICPHCGNTMGKMSPPVTVFEIDYGVPELYVCFENDCDYYRRSKMWMRSQGQPGYSYRFMLNPQNGAVGPIPDNLTGGLSSSRID